jgi:capsular polysaccharide export protein
MTAVFPLPALRIGVIDFIQLHAPFLPELARALQGRAQFHFLQPEVDAAPLMPEHAERVQLLELAPTLDCGLDDAALLKACGEHERLHAASMPALLSQARQLAGRIEAFLESSRVQAIMVWNGAPLAAALATVLARRRGMPVLFCENGYLPGTMQIDTQGVNYWSSHTPAIAAGSYRAFAADAHELDACLALLRSGRRDARAVVPRKPRPSAAARMAREAGRLFGAGGWRWLRTLGRGQFSHDLPADFGPFVLLPLHAQRDSQLSLHSPLLGADLGRLVLETYTAMRQALPQHRLVVKVHPKEPLHRNREHLSLARKFPDVRFVQGLPMQELLARCALLVTINSTAGVEAMAFDKPVVTLGRNFYTVPTLVTPVGTLECLPQALAQAASTTPDAAERRRFLGYLHQHMLVRGSHLDLGEASIRALADRVWSLVCQPANANT